MNSWGPDREVEKPKRRRARLVALCIEADIRRGGLDTARQAAERLYGEQSPLTVELRLSAEFADRVCEELS